MATMKVVGYELNGSRSFSAAAQSSSLPPVQGPSSRVPQEALPDYFLSNRLGSLVSVPNP